MNINEFSTNTGLTANQIMNESIISSGEYIAEQYSLSAVGSDADMKRIFLNKDAKKDLFEAYLSDVSNDEDKAQLTQLFENTAARTLKESSMGIDGLSSMNMPVIKKLWYATKIRQAFKTVVAKSPEMAISYMKPYKYYVTKEGQRIEKELPYNTFYTEDNTGLDRNVVIKSTGAFGKNHAPKVVYYTDKVTPIDRDFTITSLTFTNSAADNNDTFTIAVRIPRENSNSLIYDVVATDDIYVGANATEPTFARGASLGLLIVDIRLEQGVATFRYSDFPEGFDNVSVESKAHLTAENNENNWSVGLRIKKQTISIGTGLHIDAPITIEEMQDADALYSIDLMAEFTDLMTLSLSQGLEEELIDFQINSFAGRPTNEEYSNNAHYDRAERHTHKFNVATMSGFQGGPKIWREELKPVIDDAAIAITEECKFYDGKFVLVAHPSTAVILKNPDWQYKGGAGGNTNGSSISYDNAVFTSDNRTYLLITASKYPKGFIGLSFIPSGEKQISQVYYPYAYTMSTTNAYRSPNAPLVPSLIMTKRHTKFEFTPTSALIIIQGLDNTSDRFHDGDLWSVKFADKIAELGSSLTIAGQSN